MSNSEGDGARVKYTLKRVGTIDSVITNHEDRMRFEEAAAELSDALWEMEQSGVAPVCPDGKV